MRVSFRVPGVPVAQPRQRHRVVAAGGRVFASNYTPTRDPVNAFKAAVKLAASQAYQGPPLDGPLRVVLTYVLPRPKRLGVGPRVWAPVKPDRDNLMKSLQDALNEQLWVDDKLICDGPVRKLYAGAGEQPCVEVEVITL